jgi:hypothetical protein
LKKASIGGWTPPWTDLGIGSASGFQLRRHPLVVRGNPPKLGSDGFRATDFLSYEIAQGKKPGADQDSHDHGNGLALGYTRGSTEVPFSRDIPVKFGTQEDTMAQPNDPFKNPTVRNSLIGIGIAILVPVVARAISPFVRPVARSALKMGVVTYEKGREAIAEFGEIIDDMVAEVREELRAEREQAEAAFDEVVAGVEDVDETAGNEQTNGTGSA